MALEQRLTLRQTLQLRMTPQLRQAIKILQLSRPELETMLNEELLQNPVLEEADSIENRTDGTESRTGDVEKSESEAGEDSAPEREREHEVDGLGDVDMREYLERYSGDIHGSVGAGSDRDDNRERLLENTANSEEDLVHSLLDQLALLLCNEDERRLAALIIQNLDESGYMGCPPEELAFIAESSVEEILEAREVVQELEPVGCGSLDLADCLHFQLRLYGYEEDDYVLQVVGSHMADLEASRYDKIARDLGTSVDEIVECHRILRSLNPRPGAVLSRDETRYVTPDVYILRVGEEFEVILNDEALPRLQVSTYYRSSLKDGALAGDARSYVQEKVRAATWLIRSIEQRQRTLRKVTESIVSHQRRFLIDGVQHLKPMVLKDVANDIGMHESTVSRATSGKYVHTPQGLFELKYFFTSSLRSSDGGEVSSESVKQQIHDLIRNEDPRKPYSDQYICEYLSRQNIDIARRTVAKYRESMGILSSSKRRKVVELD
jgi:RNA polymerase sigma-54 factor